MRTILLTLLFALALVGCRDDERPRIEGRGDWGEETLGAACRITTDKTEYTIGDKVFILVEVKNNTDKTIVLGQEPLNKDGEDNLVHQPTKIWSYFRQEYKGRLGFFATTVSPFPNGTKSESKAVLVAHGKTYSGIVARFPWGPNFGCIPSTAQPGEMTLQVSLRKFFAGNFKQKKVFSNELGFTVKSKKGDSNLD